MRGFRAKYVWAIGALFVFTAINYLPPLLASATIDYALSTEPSDSVLTQGLIKMMGGSEYVRAHLWLPALLMILLTIAGGWVQLLEGTVGGAGLRWFGAGLEGPALRSHAAASFALS